MAGPQCHGWCQHGCVTRQYLTTISLFLTHRGPPSVLHAVYRLMRDPSSFNVLTELRYLNGGRCLVAETGAVHCATQLGQAQDSAEISVITVSRALNASRVVSVLSRGRGPLYQHDDFFVTRATVPLTFIHGEYKFCQRFVQDVTRPSQHYGRFRRPSVL